MFFVCLFCFVCFVLFCWFCFVVCYCCCLFVCVCVWGGGGVLLLFRSNCHYIIRIGNIL